MLQSKGYKIKGGAIEYIRLIDDFKDFYSKDFLKSLNCEVAYDKTCWIKLMPMKYNPQQNFIKHLLFIRFLFGSVENFASFNVEECKKELDNKFVNTILYSKHRRNSLLKDLGCSLNVAKKNAIRLGVIEKFYEKMAGYFDESADKICKRRLKEFVCQYDGYIKRKALSNTLCTEYKIVSAWDNEFITNILEEHNLKYISDLKINKGPS